MAQTVWTDAHGRRWSARMTIGEAQRLKAEDDIDLLDAEQLRSLVDDPLHVVRLICCVHAPQLTEAGITIGDFAELCTETEAVASAAAEAMVEALADFFGRLRKPALANVVRIALAAANAAEHQAAEKVATKARAKMDQAIAIKMADIDAALDLDEALPGKTLLNTRPS